MGDRLITVVDKMPLLMRNIERVLGREVLVGYPADDRGEHHGTPPVGTNERKPEKRATFSKVVGAPPITNAALAYIHENGAPEAGIPARPSLLPGVRDGKERIVGFMKDALTDALSLRHGAASRAERALNGAGLAAQASVRRKITVGPFEPLAPSTLAARKRRGVNRTKPLIDTGQMRQAVSYIIVDKSGWGRVY